jgi:uncharacterized protein (TIGR02099 family)
MAPSYLLEVESLAGEALGVRVTVSRIDLRWHLAGPALRLEGVALYEPLDGRRLAIAGEVDVGIDAISALIDREFTPGWLRISGLEIELARVADGSLQIAGGPLPSRSDPGSSRPLPDTFGLDIEASTLHWRDALAADQAVVIRGLSVHAELDSGTADLTAQLPIPGSGEEPVRVIGSWAAEGEDAGTSITAMGRGLDLAQLGRLVPVGDLALDEGSGDLRLRADLSDIGELTYLETEADLVDVTARVIAEDGDRLLSLASMSGTMRWRRAPSGWNLSVEAMRLVHGDRAHEPWDMSVDYIDDPIRERRSLTLDAGSFPLDELTWAGGFLEDERAGRMATFDLQGELLDLHLAIDLAAADPELTALTGRFRDLGWAPVDAIPGMGGLDGSFQLSHLGGAMQLDSRGVYFDAPELFRSRLSVQRMNAAISILRDGDALTLRATEVDVYNAHGHVTGRASVAIVDPEIGPELDFELQLVGGDLSAKSGYLPSGIMPEGVVTWLDRGVVSGRVPQAEFTLRGPARSYPFRDGGGIFRVRFDYEDAVLDFAEGWPVATGLHGEAIFFGPGLTVTAGGGGWEGIQVLESRAVIPDLPEGQLAVRANATPDVGALLGFIDDSPLASRFGAYLDAAEGEGPTAAEITLDIPLGSPDDLTLAGEVDLREVSLSLSDGRIPLRSVDGAIHFTRDSILGEGIDVTLWDNPAALDIRPDPEGGSQLIAQGVMDMDDLPGELRDSRLMSRVDGVLDWRLDASFPANPREDAAPRQVIFRSDLLGIDIDLPSPFRKLAHIPRDTVVTVASPQPGLIETRLVQAGHVGVTSRWHDREGWTLDRAHIRLGGGLPTMPADGGIWVSGRAERLDADAWWSLTDEEEGADGPSLTSLSLNIGELTTFGQTYTDTRVNLDRAAEGWLMHIDGAEASGTVRVPQQGPDGAPIVADFDRLSLTTGEGGDPPDPRELSAMRFSVLDFTLDGANWGGVTVVLDRIPAGLTLTEFSLQSDAHAATGTGGWIVDEGQHFSQVDLLIDSTDVANTLSRFGFNQGLTGDRAHVEAQLSWRGALFQPRLAGLDGAAQVLIEDGLVNEVSPGAGRLFGLFSINALQRRLLLDFSDLFGRGLAFDSITATYRLEQGDAYTDDLLLRGPGLDVGIAGRTGLANRDYDQQVLVNAKLGNALPLAGALAGGPVVGAALLVFSRLFRDELRDSTQVQYRVTGSWDDPVVEQVQRAAPPRQTEATDDDDS